LHNAEKTIRALHRGFVSLPSQHHDFGAIGDGTGCSTASQRDLGLLVRYQVLVEGSHRRIGTFCSLCNCLPACAGQENQQCKCQSDDPYVILPHSILPNRAFRAGEHRPRSDSQTLNRTDWTVSSPAEIAAHNTSAPPQVQPDAGAADRSPVPDLNTTCLVPQAATGMGTTTRA